MNILARGNLTMGIFLFKLVHIWFQNIDRTLNGKVPKQQMATTANKKCLYVLYIIYIIYELHTRFVTFIAWNMTCVVLCSTYVNSVILSGIFFGCWSNYLCAYQFVVFFSTCVANLFAKSTEKKLWNSYELICFPNVQ